MPPRPKSELPPELKASLQLLISANHILHNHGLVDAFGHISIRHPLRPDWYIIATYDPGAPALVSSREHFLEYNVEDSEPVKKPQPKKGYSERYIHGEIYSRYPWVQCVVHSHSEAVIPFAAADFPVKPIFHMAGFLEPHGVPVFDTAEMYSLLEQHTPDMLIKNRFLGAKLAEAFSVPSSHDNKDTDYAVVLQKKHGFTCVGYNIQQTVYRAIYTQKNCVMLKSALDLAGGDEEKISYLTPGETTGCAKMNIMTQDKAFRLWLREVQVSPLYRNEEGYPENLPVTGMDQE